MSYCSEVSLVLSPTGVKLYNKMFNELNQEEKEELSVFPEKVMMRHGEKLFYWSYVSWRSSHYLVSFFENLMTQLDNDDFLFLYIGESSSDVEERGNYYGNEFNTEIVRAIQFS